MTDFTNDPMGDDDGLFEDAVEIFPSKKDLRDRLVVVYPTGKKGARVSEATGKPYDWYETTTVVLDDGPNGWQEMVPDDDGDMTPNQVPSVAENGPQVLINFQWSAGGMTSRLAPKFPKADGKPGSVFGRINTRKNKAKGMNASWSISSPTEVDKQIVADPVVRGVCADARAEIIKANNDAANEQAFG